LHFIYKLEFWYIPCINVFVHYRTIEIDMKRFVRTWWLRLDDHHGVLHRWTIEKSTSPMVVCEDLKIEGMKTYGATISNICSLDLYLYHTFLVYNIHLESRYIWRTQYVFLPTFIMCSFALRLRHQFLQTHCLHWHKRFNVYTLFTLASKVQYVCILTT